MGIIFAWPSCTLTLFSSNHTTLHRPMSETELALFGSLSSIGALVSTPVAAYFLDLVGRKYCAVFASLCYVIAWGLIACSTQVEVVLVAVFIAGLGASAMLIVRVYVSEICQESVRGAMTTGSMVFYSLGLLLSYALGGSLEYHFMVYACLATSVVGVAMLGLMRESPTYLMKKGFEKEAAESVAFYRRVDCDSKEVLQEMDALRRAFNPDLEQDAMDEAEKLTEDKLEKLQPKKCVKKLSFWKFIKNSRSTRKATMLTIILVTAGTFQGLLVVQVYAKPLFEEAVPSMSSIVCSVLQALVTVVAGLVSGYLSDLAGRRVRNFDFMMSWYNWFHQLLLSMSSIVCSVLQALVTVVAGLVSGYLSDLAGRRVRNFDFMMSWYNWFHQLLLSMSSIECSVLQALVTVVAGLVSGYLSDLAGRRVRNFDFMMSWYNWFHQLLLSMSSIVCSVLQALVTVVAGLVSGYLSDLAGRRVRNFDFMISWYNWFHQLLLSMSSIVFSVLQALATVVAGLVKRYLSDLAGRRPLIIYSSIAAGACCVALGTQLHFHWAPHSVTALFLYLFTITYTFGAGTVPYVLVADVFLPEIRSVMSMLVIQWCWLCSFIILFIFNPLVSLIGLGPIFYLFSGVCLFTAVFSGFCLPETKGLAVDAVQDILVGRRK
ncbi:hypothetical protein O0L34_g10184 [Tuta absoluta]|nr:hypothetical protein O0L34_g10184 [Tuta absoluta]